MFENSLKLIEDCAIVHGHIFPYSAKTGTPAAKMPPVPSSEIKARAKLLRDRVKQSKAAWQNSLHGSMQKIVVESDGLSGHSENFAYVEIDMPLPAGTIVAAQIKGITNGKLQGIVAA